MIIEIILVILSKNRISNIERIQCVHNRTDLSITRKEKIVFVLENLINKLLEFKRHIVCVCNSYTVWVVRPNYEVVGLLPRSGTTTALDSVDYCYVHF